MMAGHVWLDEVYHALWVWLLIESVIHGKKKISNFSSNCENKMWKSGPTGHLIESYV